MAEQASHGSDPPEAERGTLTCEGSGSSHTDLLHVLARCETEPRILLAYHFPQRHVRDRRTSL